MLKTLLSCCIVWSAFLYADAIRKEDSVITLAHSEPITLVPFHKTNVPIRRTIPIVLMGPSTVYIAHELNEAQYEDGSDCRLEGWGERLWQYATNDSIASQIYNFAQPGSNTQTFQIPPEEREGNDKLSYGPNRDHYWAKVVEKMRALKNGILLIQFGANGDTEAQFKSNMRKFIQTARSLHFTPIVLTEMAKRIRTNGQYNPGRGNEIRWMREIAEEQEVPLLDLFEKSSRVYAQMTEQQWDEEFADCYSKWYRGDTPPKQNTHFEPKGALKAASWIRDLACEQAPNGQLCRELQGTPRKLFLSSTVHIPEHGIPPMHWNNIPKGTKSLAVIVDDHSANHWVHWAVANLDPTRFSIVATRTPSEGMVLKNQNGEHRYADPAYPHDHIYEIHIYAMDVNKLSETHRMQGTHKVPLFDPEHIYNHLDFEKKFGNFIIDKASHFFKP